MKRLLLSAVALVALSSCGRPKADAAQDPSIALHRIADDYLAAMLDLSPFLVVYGGLGDVAKEDHAAMEDNSPEALARFQQTEDELYGRLSAVANADFAGADWVLYETLKEGLEASKGVRVCKQQFWNIDHMSGWQNAFPLVADAQPVDTAVKRGMALARWRQFPAYLEQDRENLSAGLAAGYSAPKRVVARVIAQLDAIIAAPASPFLSFVARGGEDETFNEAMNKLARDEITPALVAYRDFLRDDYLPKARDALSIKAIPDGEACYEALLRRYHTAAIGGKATFDRGKATVAANRRDVIQRGETLFGESDFGAILQLLKDAPGNRFASEAEVVEVTRTLVPATREKVAPFFSKLPAQDVVVEPFPDFLKGTGQSSRYEPKAAAEGAAVYRINTDEWATQTKGEAEIVAVHEGWPGHHLQIATAYAVEGLHPVTRLLGSTAYIEGWARYAEGLAEEAGIYTKGYGEISRRAWPARGMVMDPGLHLFGWTNEQVKAFLLESGRFDEEGADVMLDRLAVIPGQLTAYDTGGLEIAALRAEAMKRLGARFDIQAFHDRVLENGAVPLAALRAHVEEWIAAEEAKGTGG